MSALQLVNVEGLWGKVCCSTAVSNVYGDRRTMGVTAVDSAADGRHTMNITVKRVYDRGKIE